MFEIITQINDLIKRVGKLESLEIPFGITAVAVLPSASTYTGRRFFLTTNNVTYVSDGTNWNPVGGSVITLNRNIRVFDSTNGGAGFVAGASANVQVTGVTDTLGLGGTLPPKITGVFVHTTIFASAAGNTTMSLENPSFSAGVVNLAGWANAANGRITGLIFTSLNASGQLKYALNGTGANRFIFDVVAYTL